MFGKLLSSSKGALDLSSIMVGVIVISLIGGVIGATVFAVIPWAQDHAAKQQLQSIAVAQNVYAGFDASEWSNTQMSLTAAVTPTPVAAGYAPNYGSLKNLVDAGLIQLDVSDSDSNLAADGKLCVVVDEANSYRVEIRSATGNLFFIQDGGASTGLTQDETKCLPAENNESPARPAPQPEKTEKPAEPISEATPAQPEKAAEFTVTSGDYWTEGTEVNGKKTAVLVIPSITVTSDSAKKTDWSVKLDRTKAPWSGIPAGEVKVLSGLPGWAAVTSDESSITLSNKTAGAYPQISSNEQVRFGELRFEFTAPFYNETQTTNTGVERISNAGTNTVQGSTTVSLNDTTEARYGYWATVVDVSAMKKAVGQNGSASLNPSWTEKGFSLKNISGERYLLTYQPSNDHSFMLKGKEAGHNNLNSGSVTFDSLFRFTGDGKISATVTPGAVRGDQWYAVQTFNIKTEKNGHWTADVNLKDLRDKNRSKNPVVNHGAFKLVQKSGDVYTLSFTGDNYQVNNVDIQLS